MLFASSRRKAPLSSGERILGENLPQPVRFKLSRFCGGVLPRLELALKQPHVAQVEWPAIGGAPVLFSTWLPIGHWVRRRCQYSRCSTATRKLQGGNILASYLS
jgi:hypothetical protein